MLITFPVNAKSKNKWTILNLFVCKAHLFGLVHSSRFTTKRKGMLMIFPKSKIKEQTNKTYIRSAWSVRLGLLKKRRRNVSYVSKSKEMEQTNKTYICSFVQDPIRSAWSVRLGSLKKRRNVSYVPKSKEMEQTNETYIRSFI